MTGMVCPTQPSDNNCKAEPLLAVIPGLFHASIHNYEYRTGVT